MTCTYRDCDICSTPLCHLCLPIDVNGLHWLRCYFLNPLIVKEAGDLTGSHQEFKLMPHPIIKSLSERLFQIISVGCSSKLQSISLGRYNGWWGFLYFKLFSLYSLKLEVHVSKHPQYGLPPFTGF